MNNPEGEKDQIVAEGLQQALMAGVQQQAASGQMPPATVAKLIRWSPGSDGAGGTMTAIAAQASPRGEGTKRAPEEIAEEEQTLDQAMAPANLAAMTRRGGPDQPVNGGANPVGPVK